MSCGLYAMNILPPSMWFFSYDILCSVPSASSSGKTTGKVVRSARIRLLGRFVSLADAITATEWNLWFRVNAICSRSEPSATPLVIAARTCPAEITTATDGRLGRRVTYTRAADKKSNGVDLADAYPDDFNSVNTRYNRHRRLQLVPAMILPCMRSINSLRNVLFCTDFVDVKTKWIRRWTSEIRCVINPPSHSYRYLYNRCLSWYNVVLTPGVHASVKYCQQSTVTVAVSCDGESEVC